MMNLWIVIISFLFVLIHSGTYNATFLITWMGGHCQNLGPKCDKDKYDQWDHQSFTIHGLRVTRKKKGQYGSFNFQLLRKNQYLLSKMYDFWPPQPQINGKPHFLWEYEWKNYGQRFAQIYYIQTGEDNRNTLQRQFFEANIQLYESLKVKKLKSNRYSKYEFSYLVGIPYDSFYFICNKNDILTDVKICYQINLSWSKWSTKYRSCSFIQQDSSNCSSSSRITLYDWQSQPNYKVEPMSDQYYQELKDNDELVYYPEVEMAEDEKIEEIAIDTKKYQDQRPKKQEEIEEIQIDTKGKSQKDEQKRQPQKEISDAERAQVEENMENELHFGSSGQQLYAQSQMLDMLLLTIVVIAISTSLVWIAFITCICKCRSYFNPKKQTQVLMEQSIKDSKEKEMQKIENALKQENMIEQ